MTTRLPAALRRRTGAALAGLSLVLCAACTEQVAGTGSLAEGATLPHLPGPGSSSTPTPAPTPTDGTCAGADAPTRSVALSARVLKSPPSRLPLDRQQSGPMTENRLIAISPQPGQTKRILDAARFVGGYQNGWSKGQIGTPGSAADFVTIYEFADSAGACRFYDWEKETYTLQPVPELAVPGALGTSTQDTGGPGLRACQYTAVKGRYVVSSGAVLFGRTDAGPRGRDLFRRQYPLV